MQPVINAPEIATAREQQLFNGKNFHGDAANLLI